MIKQKLLKFWLGVMFITPFLLMFGLHIGNALGTYFGININVEGISSSDWFMFAGSYLGGAMTLIGVTITLQQERKSQHYQDELHNIEQEREHLGHAIGGLNVITPTTIYERFMELPIMPMGYNPLDVSLIRQLISQERENINKLRLEVIFLTDIYESAACTTCKSPCGLKEVRLEFQKVYDEMANQFFAIYQKIENFIVANENNLRYQRILNDFRQKKGGPQEERMDYFYDESTIKAYENKIVDVKHMQQEIVAELDVINEFNKKEIIQLTTLARGYIAVRRQNVEKRCYISN